MKKIYSAAMLSLTGLLALIILFTACAKSNNNPSSGDCQTCEVKNASSLHVDNKTFCSESDKSSYLADHPGYTMECDNFILSFKDR